MGPEDFVYLYCCPNCGMPNGAETVDGRCAEEDCRHDLTQYKDYRPGELSCTWEFYRR